MVLIPVVLLRMTSFFVVDFIVFSTVSAMYTRSRCIFSRV